MAIIGYARVSTEGQTLDAQLAELTAAGATRIFKEKVSGARSDRPELAKLMAAAQPGDLVLVCRLDRLARSTRDLLNILASLGEKGCAFRSIHDAWADTTTAQGKLMITILGGLAEYERGLIAARTGDGRARAKAAGVKFGRKPKLTAYQRQEALRRRAEGETLAAIGKSYGVSHSMISRL